MSAPPIARSVPSFVQLNKPWNCPQKKQKAKTEEMHNQMEPGDNIMTTRGFYGTILDIVDDTTIIVEFGNNKNCRIPMHKNAVAELEKKNAAVVEEDKEKK